MAGDGTSSPVPNNIATAPGKPVKLICDSWAPVRPATVVPKNNLPPVAEAPAVPVHPLITKLVPPVHPTAELFENFMECAFEPKSILLLAVRFTVAELVNVVAVVIFVVLSLPPFKMIWEAKVLVVVAGFNLNSPAVIVVEPVYVFAGFKRVSVPEPCLVKRVPALALEPLMTPANDVELASPTVKLPAVVV